MSIEDMIRKIVNEELDKREQKTQSIPVAEFCRLKNISRTSVWRAEKEGRLKVSRIGKKIFINTDQL